MCQQSLETSGAPVNDPHTEAGLMYIAEYLKSKAYSPEQLAELPAASAKALLAEASQYASLRLAQREMGAAFIHVIHPETAITTAPVTSTAA